MATITIQGNPIHTNGDLPAVGSKAPAFTLTDKDLNDVTLSNWAGRKKVLDVAVSLETSTCATSAKVFNERIAGRDDAVVLVITGDLPFAQSRFCSDNKLSNIVSLSMMRNRNFAKDYGILMTDGPLAGLTARAIIVIDENDNVVHTQLVPEVSHEPDYDAALKALG